MKCLGKIITIQLWKKNYLMKESERIPIEVEETFTSSEKKVVPTFGTPKENIIRKLMKGRK